MKSHVTVAIIDNNRYFAQGLRYLLTRYMASRGKSVSFLPPTHRALADLVFQADNVHFPMYYHPFDNNGRQRVIRIRECREATAPRAEGVISRRDPTQALQQQLESQPAVLSHRPRRNGPMVLTNRERQVLMAIKHAMIPVQIARYLNLSVKTVSTHKLAAMRKLGFRRNAELYQWLRQGGLDLKKREFL